MSHRWIPWFSVLALCLGCPPDRMAQPHPSPGGDDDDAADDDAGDDDDVADDDDASDDDSGDDDATPDGPAVMMLSPTEGEVEPNPVTFEFQVFGDGEIVSVEFFCDDWPLQDEPIPVDVGVHTHTYSFSGVNMDRTVELLGYDASGAEVDSDTVTFFPAEGLLDDEPGFNGYIVDAINDWSTYPKNGTYPYCWSYYGDECGDMWGMIWGTYYLDQEVFEGGLDCFCTGHTLEVFFDAYERWQAANGVDIEETFGGLSMNSLDVGDFYQYWQGFGVTNYASAADALESAGIGTNLYEEDWDDAMTGDLLNLSRDTGTGHSVFFVDWVWDGVHRAGLRYYGCQGCGDSHPDPSDPGNTTCNSGPAYVTEYFSDFGGHVIPEWVFIGHPYDPGTL